MAKKVIEKKPLLYTEPIGATYMDEHGMHKVEPGQTVEFTVGSMYDFHLAEPCWKVPKVKKEGE